MAAVQAKRSFYRERTAYSINRMIQPVVSKLILDVQNDKMETPNKAIKSTSQQKAHRPAGTVLDRIISKLKKDTKDQDILLMITPASRHANQFKLHVIQRDQQIHLGMITVTEDELSHLKVSKAFQNYSIIFASRYVNFVQSDKIQNLIGCLDRKCCSVSKEMMALRKETTTINLDKSNCSYAGDYFQHEAVKVQNSCIQTEPDEQQNKSFSLNDIYTLMEIINCTLQPCHKDIKRFFYMAEQLNFSMVVRPQLLWKAADIVDRQNGHEEHVLLESYLPGSSYMGCITLKENDLLQVLDLYPKLLANIHVIEDVFELTPLPKQFVMALKNVLVFLKLELLYDALGEFLFDCYKNFTYL